jgi:hypothetical protein
MPELKKITKLTVLFFLMFDYGCKAVYRSINQSTSQSAFGIHIGEE